MSNRSGYNIVNQYACYFVTFTAVGWVDIFSRRACKQIIIDALQYCIRHKGLRLHAYVVMESHLHLVASAREDSPGLSAIIRDFKKHTSKESRKEWMLMVFKYHAKYNKRNGEYQVWKQDNRPKVMYYPRFMGQKIQYIHQNPVVAGIVDRPEDYLHSSARNYLGRSDFLIEVEVIDLGNQEGFVAM